TAGRLVVGDASTGAITVSAAVTLTDVPLIKILQLTSADSINGSSLVKVATVELNAGTGIGNVSALSLEASSIAANTTNGAIDIANSNLAAVATASTGLGTISLSNDKADLTLKNVSGSSVSATTTTSGDILVGVVAAAGSVVINAAEAIKDNNGAADKISGTALSLQATTGIGSGNALQTQVASLSAKNTVSGTIELSNSGKLTVTDIE